MDWFVVAQRYYDLGIYNTIPGDFMYLGNFVEKGKITAEQYKEITNKEYQEV